MAFLDVTLIIYFNCHLQTLVPKNLWLLSFIPDLKKNPDTDIMSPRKTR